MADIYEVQSVLASLAQSAIYPNGTGSSSISSCDVRIYPGAPIPATLDADLTARKAHVTIFPSTGKWSTRFDKEWQQASTNASTIILTVSNDLTQITVS